MLDQTADRWGVRRLPRVAALANMATGLLVMASWPAHWQKFLQWIPNTAPMQFNTGICFFVCGVGLWLLTFPRNKFAMVCGGGVAIFAFLTLLEYVSGGDFHIDQLFFHPYFETATAFPGRMAPLSAVCFVMVGAAILLAGGERSSPHALEISGLLMCMVGVIASVAIVGFAFGIEAAYGWGAYSSLAVNTSVLFLVLSGGMLLHAAGKAQAANSNFVRWLPVTASVTLMMMVAIVAAVDVQKLQAAAIWRKEIMQTIFAANSLESALVDQQRGMRAYLTLPETSSLAAFQEAADSQGAILRRLLNLTANNVSGQTTVKRIAAMQENLLAYDRRLIQLFKDNGSNAVSNSAMDQQVRGFFGQTHDAIKSFVAAERKLWDLREAAEEADIHDTRCLVIAGCALAVGLLLLANFMASRELTRRKRAELQLAAQAQALRRSNTELEQFAHVASHDMREPLRAISGFAQLLKMQCADAVGGEGRETIGRIVDGAKRMSNIIDDLLALSSLSSQKRPFEMTELEKPLQLALENLSVLIREREVILRRHPLPKLWLDSSQITLLFQNLIGNAIKFCPGRRPEIDILAERAAGHAWTISVRDNGIGIDPKYFGKIFGIFQRLHSREEYPGTGIGLAICKKIIERHGGTIWLESQPGTGTTFSFTMTDRAPQKYDGEKSPD